MCELREKTLYIRFSLAAGSPSRGKQVLNKRVELLLSFLEFSIELAVQHVCTHAGVHCGLRAELMYRAAVLY